MRIHPTERRDARRYVAAASAVEPFVHRQRRARLRVALADAFYRRYPSRMGALHELAVAGIAIARFAALSEVYDRIGDLLIPTCHDGHPRTELWARYVEAFQQGSPDDVIEEHWLRAHFEDMEAVKAAGLVEQFARELSEHAHDPTWQMLDEHMRVTLGTRLDDRAALAGRMALETAIATSLSRVFLRQLQTGLALVRTYVVAAARGTILGGPWTPQHLPSDRWLVWQLCSATARTARVSHVWRLGRRRRHRGIAHPDRAWSLVPALRQVLGPQVERLDATVYQFFDRMDGFRLTASVELFHQFGSMLAWVGTLLTGQGMYEEHLDEVDARFRLFQRDDGSMHFVREFWCADEVRVFDSDFVVREVDGRPALLEVFEGLGIAARMHTEVTPEGGLMMTISALVIRGVCVGTGPIFVRFTTRPSDTEGHEEEVQVRGVLELRPRGGWSSWLLRISGLPKRLGEIRYWAKRTSEAADTPDEVPSPD